jgi:hypothetical protein
MSDLTSSDWMQDLRLNLTRLEDIVTETEQLIIAGNLDGAALVLGSQDGKIQRFQESYSGLYSKLFEEGADPTRR